MATIVTAKQVAHQVAAAAVNVATLLTVAASFARYHTRGTQAMCSYRVAGAQGIVFTPCAMFVGGVCPPLVRFSSHALGVAAPKGHTALVYRGAVAGGKAGRHSYGVPGMRGTFTICATLLGTAPAPAVLHINVVLAAPALPQVGKATSAVVAAGNVAIATATAAGKAVATPRKVAAVAAKVAAAKVAAAQRQAAIAHAVSMAS